MNPIVKKKQPLVLWHEVVLIGLAILLVAAANNQLITSLSPTVLPVNLSPDTVIESPAIIESA